MKLRIVQANTLKEFEQKCEDAIGKDYMFLGQVIITGLGQGKFMYTQQWGKGIQPEKEEEVKSGDE